MPKYRITLYNDRWPEYPVSTDHTVASDQKAVALAIRRLRERQARLTSRSVCNRWILLRVNQIGHVDGRIATGDRDSAT